MDLKLLNLNLRPKSTFNSSTKNSRIVVFQELVLEKPNKPEHKEITVWHNLNKFDKQALKQLCGTSEGKLHSSK